jgi:CubicO group peptidase (beta-lactamase class C family)
MLHRRFVFASPVSAARALALRTTQRHGASRLARSSHLAWVACLVLTAPACEQLLGNPFDSKAATDASTSAQSQRDGAVRAADSGSTSSERCTDNACMDGGPSQAPDAGEPNMEAGKGGAVAPPDKRPDGGDNRKGPDTGTTPAEAPLAPYVTYQNVDVETHEARMKELQDSGYRPTALTVTNEPDDARYAAVWTLEDGPEWREAHQLSPSELEQRRDELAAEGFNITSISATGAIGREVFAVLFERDAPGRAAWDLHWSGSDAEYEKSIQQANGEAYRDNHRPKSVTIYGASGEKRYAGVWAPNSSGVLWSSFTLLTQDYSQFYEHLVDLGMRPAVFGAAQDDLLAITFLNEQLASWKMYRSLDLGEYEAALKSEAGEGRHPIMLTAGGFAGAVRYTVLFASDEMPIAKQLDVQRDDAAPADSTQLDDALADFMRQRGVRACTLAAARDGEIKLSRAYTYAEPDFPRATPGLRFRIANLSAIFSNALTAALVRDGKLAWDAPAFAAAGVTSALPAGVTPDVATDAISVEEIVTSSTRLIGRFDVPRAIARALGSNAAPLPRAELLAYLRGLPLLSAAVNDSSPAFYLLTSIIEQAAGVPYLDALQQYVLTPLDITDVSVGKTLRAGRLENENTRYESGNIGESQLDYSPGVLLSTPYGGAFVLENAEGALGLVTSAPSLVKLLSRHPVFPKTRDDLAGRAPGAAFGWALDGSYALAISRAEDDIDVAVLCNHALNNAHAAELRMLVERYLAEHGAQL